MKERIPNLQKNTLYNLMKTMSTVLYPLIVFPYITRVLQVENIGKINFANSIVSYFSLIASLGITTYAVRECSRVRTEKAELSKIASQIYSINICTTGAAYLLLALCLIGFATIRDYELLIAIESLSIIMTTMGTEWLNTAMEDFRYITVRTCAFQVVALVMMLLFVQKPEDYYIYAVTNIISSSGAQIVNIFYRKRYCKVRFTVHIEWKKHLKPIVLLFAMMLSQTILNSIDTTMLGLIDGDYAVGLYSTALKVKNIVSQVVASIAWVVMPQLSAQFAEKNYEKINELLHGALVFTVSVGLPCIAGIIILAPDILEIIGGTEYIAASNCLRILTVSMGISFISGIYGNMILLPSMREKQFMLGCIFAALTNIIANFLLIPVYSLDGAAIATVVSSIVILLSVTHKIEEDIHWGNLRPIITAPLIGCSEIIVVALIIREFVDGLLIRAVTTVILSVALYLFTLTVLKNEFAITTIIPIQKKIKKILKYGRK